MSGAKKGTVDWFVDLETQHRTIDFDRCFGEPVMMQRFESIDELYGWLGRGFNHVIEIRDYCLVNGRHIIYEVYYK